MIFTLLLSLYMVPFSASYPETVPGVIVRPGSCKLTVEEVEMLQASITFSAGERLGSAMIHNFIQDARTWLENHTCVDDVSASGVEEQEASSSTKPKKMSKAKKRNQEKDTTDCSKKLPMKTASDVISRIVWDELLLAGSFTIGYIDRFRGVIENNFTAFCWDDLASVDHMALAIPQHRIQYFKYHDIKVWDKNDRLDNVFGSTGSGVTIAEVMARHEEERPQKQTTASRESHDDDGADNDVGINVGTPSCSVRDEFHNGHQENLLRPNYFLCVRITEPQIVERLEALQESILKAAPQYDECCIKPAALHITLCTLRLETPEQISAACQALENASAELRIMAQRNINLTIKGVSNFNNRVMFGQIRHDKDFTDFAEHVRMTICKSGADILDGYDYVPHMTIMKVTRPAERRLHQRTIDPAIFERVKDIDFGTETIDAVHLCSMKEKTEDGFYRCAASVKLLEIDQ